MEFEKIDLIYKAKQRLEKAGADHLEAHRRYLETKNELDLAGQNYMRAYQQALDEAIEQKKEKEDTTIPEGWNLHRNLKPTPTPTEPEDEDDALTESVRKILDEDKPSEEEQPEEAAPEQPDGQEEEQEQDEEEPEQEQAIKPNPPSADLSAKRARDIIRSIPEDKREEFIDQFLSPTESRKTVIQEAVNAVGQEAVDEILNSKEEATKEDEPDTEPEPETESPAAPPAAPPKAPPSAPVAPKAPEKPKAPVPSSPNPPPPWEGSEDEQEPEEKQQVKAPPQPAPPPKSSGTSDKVELPEGVTRPDAAPACFGNPDVYDPDKNVCMMCIFDLECKQAIEARS